MLTACRILETDANFVTEMKKMDEIYSDAWYDRTDLLLLSMMQEL